MIARAHPNPLPAETTDEYAAVVASRSGDLEEAALVDAAIAGEPAAFAALYDRHVARVYGHCYYRTGNRADAEDLTQQTFLQAWQAIGRYRRGRSPVIAWLLTISQNLAMSHHRRVREVTVPDLLMDGTEDETNPAVILSAALTRDAVRAAILQLPLERQRVILLRFIEGFSVGEVAAALGKTENNVRVIQHRAVADLRRLLAGPAPEEHPGQARLADRVRSVIQATVGKAPGH